MSATQSTDFGMEYDTEESEVKEQFDQQFEESEKKLPLFPSNSCQSYSVCFTCDC